MDAHVGSRIRLRRMVIGLSQEKLGERMGLTFQQIQRYEKGTNRVGATRLYQLSGILDVPMQFFFEDAPNPMKTSATFGSTEVETILLRFLNSSDGLEFVRAFIGISDPKVRKGVVELVRALTDDVSMEVTNRSSAHSEKELIPE
jgi:transcriptional regulator with XRE-family HTH domain